MKRIGLVARELGVSVRTLVRLEKGGAFRARRDRNGTRVFDDQDFARLREILYPAERPDPTGQPEEGGDR
jgi:DNA-binding transcriptional MerR regulator